jgi:glucan phosphoethanolaminetransferase (alkaline phosphatase superfamily)
MELDEFKAHWNSIQDKEFNQQKISPEKLEQIIMNTTDTLGQLHSKSVYWKKMGKLTTQMLIGMLAVFFLIVVIKAIYEHRLADVLTSAVYTVIMVVYCIVTVWVYERQEQIFTVYNSENVKETLKQTITAFKRFYLMFNIIYLFLYPAFFYAVIKFLMPYWHPSPRAVFITCALATAISLIASHWYYKVKYFPKLRSLNANLKELEG